MGERREERERGRVVRCVRACVYREEVLTRWAKASTEHRLRDITKGFGAIREGEVGSSNWEAGSVQGGEVVEVLFEHDLHDLQNKTRRKKKKKKKEKKKSQSCDQKTNKRRKKEEKIFKKLTSRDGSSG